MRKTIVLALSITLFGCATPTQLRSQSPDFTTTSGKDAITVANCIAEQWEATPMNELSISVRPIKGGYSVSASFWGDTPYLCNVTTQGNGSRTAFHSRKSAYVGGYLKDVKDCQ